MIEGRNLQELGRISWKEIWAKLSNLHLLGVTGGRRIQPKPFLVFCGFGERRLGLILQNFLSTYEGRIPSSIQQLAT